VERDARRCPSTLTGTPGGSLHALKGKVTFVAKPTATVWARDGHTGAKHELLRRYLQAWVPILLSKNRRVTYAEGFAGPGVYSQGEPGSPIIALRTFCQYPELLGPASEAHLVLVEEVSKRVARLEQELTAAKTALGPLPPALRILPVITGDGADVLAPALNSCQAGGSPMFVFLDSFGGPDIPFDLLRLVAGNRSSEVLLTFGPQFLTRHGENPTHRVSGDAAFGGTHWQGVFDEEPNRKLRYLVEAYRQTFRLAGFDYSLGFVMLDEGGHELWLLFATSSVKGVEKMKDAMWSVDPVHGVRYRDPRDPDQMSLDIEAVPDAAPLARMLADRLKAGPQTLDELRHWTNLDTIYTQTQVKATVRSLLNAGRLHRPPHGQLNGTTVLSSGIGPPTPTAPPAEQGELFR